MSEAIVRDERSAYPWSCVLFGHRWFKRVGLQGAYRHGVCRRCVDVRPPKWMVERDPDATWERTADEEDS